MWQNIDLSSQECKTRQFPFVDVMKLFCAILVITVHTNPLSNINVLLNYGLVQYVARLAVPFFFVSSGYFCFRKTQLDNFDLKIPIAYAKKVFFLYLFWSAIYLPQVCYKVYNNENGIVYGILDNLKTFVFTGYHHLWYLLATAIAVTLIAVALYKKIRLNQVLIVGCILYIIGVFGQSYFELLRQLEGTVIWTILKIYQDIFQTTRNGFFEGVLFVGIGALFAYRKVVLKKATAICGLAVSMFLLLIEAFCVKQFNLARANDLYVFLVPSIFFLFYIASHIEIKPCNFTHKARTYSSLIYFTHAWINFPIVNLIAILVGKIAGTAEYEMHSLLRFVIVSAGAFVVSYMIIFLQKYKCFKWLRKLY